MTLNIILSGGNEEKTSQESWGSRKAQAEPQIHLDDEKIKKC